MCYSMVRPADRKGDHRNGGGVLEGRSPDALRGSGVGTSEAGGSSPAVPGRRAGCRARLAWGACFRSAPGCGSRVALGAEAGQISWLTFRRSLCYLAIGLPAGFLGALGVGQVLQAVLVISPTDPMTLAGIVALFAVVSLLACLIPAQRAARLDPMVALRPE